MGRYCFGDLDYKFWFGIQPTADILAYGKKLKSSADLLNVLVEYSSFGQVKRKVDSLKKSFEEQFKITRADFVNDCQEMCIGDNRATQAKKMQSGKWQSMAEAASLIELGEQIVFALERKKEDLLIWAEC